MYRISLLLLSILITHKVVITTQCYRLFRWTERVRVAFLHSPGAYDEDGDSLSYEMSIPSSSSTSFADYEDPKIVKLM